ncbi:MAG: hypothetical protein AB7P12_00170 [Alphaproteobacteria bacterium]
MTKSILTVLAVLFALSAPAFASGVIYQEEPAAGSGQPSGEGGEQEKVSD